MAQVINTNLISLNTQRNLTNTQSALATSVQRLSSGLRVNSAKDDAAGLAIAERMNAQVRGMNVAIRNANDGISMAQTAEGALGKVGDMLQRMRELSVQAANATNGADDRANLNAEFAALGAEIDRTISSTKFNGVAILASAATHTFQVLTKRPGRMRALLTSPDFKWQVWHQMLTLTHARSMTMPAEHAAALTWPLPNVWLGVSVETQKWADVRIPTLLATPARVRFLSMEPLLAPVTLSSWTLLPPPQLHWVIVGGESGPGARRMDHQWAADLAAECRCAGIAFFMKQTGTVLAREWGIPGKGEDPTLWPAPLPQQMPGPAA